MHLFSEDTLIEQTAMKLLGQLGWRTVDAMEEDFGTEGLLGRESRREVILERELMAALRSLNPDLQEVALRLALEAVTLDRSAMTVIQANRELYELLKGGVPVTFNNAEGEQVTERVTVIDWNTPENNRFLAVQQLWVTNPDGLWTRRPDVVGFVNGLPWVLVELKAAHKNLVDGFNDNLRDYRDTIPQLFVPNAFIVVSNGLEARVGTLTAGWEHFVDWKKVEREDEPKRPGLETLLRGMCEPGRLLDLVENFVLYSEGDGHTLKILAKNHQYLGVNNALEALRHAKANGGKLGVFWHTQGSGKSFSMVFFAQKVLRKVPGNWSFVVVTDRDELDSQIYRTFARTGAVTEPENQVRADSGAGLRKLLQEDHRYLFTLIQKFRTDRNEVYPTLTLRDDVIVMTDEAHRSQYDVFAGNMRQALPNAAFIGFTGTPSWRARRRPARCSAITSRCTTSGTRWRTGRRCRCTTRTARRNSNSRTRTSRRTWRACSTRRPWTTRPRRTWSGRSGGSISSSRGTAAWRKWRGTSWPTSWAVSSSGRRWSSAWTN